MFSEEFNVRIDPDTESYEMTVSGRLSHIHAVCQDICRRIEEGELSDNDPRHPNLSVYPLDKEDDKDVLN